MIKLANGRGPAPPGVSITMLSAGIRGGNFALMTANGKTYNMGKRGISMFVLNLNNGNLIS